MLLRRFQDSQGDELYVMMQQSKAGDGFVRDVKAPQNQLLSLAMIGNLMTYQHLLLTTRRYGKPPVFVGPVFIHYRNNFGSFKFFATSLVALRSSFEGLWSFGTDGEKALVDAF